MVCVTVEDEKDGCVAGALLPVDDDLAVREEGIPISPAVVRLTDKRPSDTSGPVYGAIGVLDGEMDGEGGRPRRWLSL